MECPRMPQTSCQRRVGLLTVAVALGYFGIVPVLAQTPESDDRPTIESRLKDGWQIAGYTGADDGWSAFILLRHPDRSSPSSPDVNRIAHWWLPQIDRRRTGRLRAQSRAPHRVVYHS